MMQKNFLGAGKKKSDRALWLTGALVIFCCAFMAAGVLDDDKPLEAVAEATTTATQVEATDAIPSTVEAGVEPKPLGKVSRSKRMTSPSGPGMSSVWRTLGGLGLVLALIFVGAKYGARFMKQLRMKPEGEKVLELIDAIPLGPKRQVFVISAYGRKIVVGATAESMSVLSEFDQDEIAIESGARPANFEQRLDRNMDRQQVIPRGATLEVEA